jgi:cytochrome c oxidase assembly factor CtaG
VAYLTDWQFESPLPTVALVAALYAIGWRKRAAHRPEAGVQAALFAAGLGALVLAFASPLATLDGQLFWAHMTQHVLLLAVAPPLILLGRPWSTTWRAFPLSLRRAAAHGVLRASRSAPVRMGWRTLTAPLVSLGLFCGTLALWHLPGLYDLTLRSAAAHELEHALFLSAGLLLWSQLIDAPPVRSDTSYPARAFYATVAMTAGWVLAIALAVVAEPLYAYAEAASRPGGISALADQQLAAGIMWVPGSIPFAAAILVFVYRWLESEGAGT